MTKTRAATWKQTAPGYALQLNGGASQPNVRAAPDAGVGLRGLVRGEEALSACAGHERCALAQHFIETYARTRQIRCRRPM